MKGWMVRASRNGRLFRAIEQIQQDYLPFASAKYILGGNNTPQAYGQRKLAKLKLGGYFFLGAE